MPQKNKMMELFIKTYEWLKGFYAKNKTLFIIIAAGIVIAGCVVVYASVELTSTVAFCTSCHEMKTAHDTWKDSKHYNVPKGKKMATCRDCHLPPWTHPVQLLFEKAYHGAKDVTAHFTRADEFDEPGFYFDMKVSAAHGVHNYNCMKCHQDLYKKKYEGYDNIHKIVKNNPRMSCVKCHEGLVHKQYLPEAIR